MKELPMKRMNIRKKKGFPLSSKKFFISGICILFSFFFSYFSNNVTSIGSSLCLSHIPVFVGGFLCGYPFGFFIGFFSAVLSGIFFSIPWIPDIVSAAVELSSYGCMIGLMYHFLPKHLESIFTALIISMTTGKVLWGVSRLICSCFGFSSLTFHTFWDYTVLSCIPGILLTLFFVPFLILAIQQVRFMNHKR